MQTISPCIWLNDRADEAAKLYVSLFKNSKIEFTSYFGKAGAEMSGQKEGSVLAVDVLLEGFAIQLLNGGPHYTLNPSTSLYVWCQDENEINFLWKSLSERGSTLFELQKYPWAERYGWCTDRFGVSWQLMIGPSPYKIAPAILFTEKVFGKAEEAIQFYLSKFENSKLEYMAKDPATQAVLYSLFNLEGTPFVLMEGPSKGKQKMQITGAMSFVINCNDQKEIDQHWESLKKPNGMEVCGWIEDKFGVQWQVIPAILGKLLRDPNKKKIEAMMAAMFKMTKLEIEPLKKAFANG